MQQQKPLLHHLSALIPVPVTGIQPRRVRAVNDSIGRKRVSRAKDLGALDPCDEHRDEGAWRGVTAQTSPLSAPLGAAFSNALILRCAARGTEPAPAGRLSMRP
ncbi:UNVERIFIED_ORG: hypothetical protein BTE55_22585 [Rhizobium sophorae]